MEESTLDATEVKVPQCEANEEGLEPKTETKVLSLVSKRTFHVEVTEDTVEVRKLGHRQHFEEVKKYSKNEQEIHGKYGSRAPVDQGLESPYGVGHVQSTGERNGETGSTPAGNDYHNVTKLEQTKEDSDSKTPSGQLSDRPAPKDPYNVPNAPVDYKDENKARSPYLSQLRDLDVHAHERDAPEKIYSISGGKHEAVTGTYHSIDTRCPPASDGEPLMGEEKGSQTGQSELTVSNANCDKVDTIVGTVIAPEQIVKQEKTVRQSQENEDFGTSSVPSKTADNVGQLSARSEDAKILSSKTLSTNPKSSEESWSMKRQTEGGSDHVTGQADDSQAERAPPRRSPDRAREFVAFADETSSAHLHARTGLVPPPWAPTTHSPKVVLSDGASEQRSREIVQPGPRVDQRENVVGDKSDGNNNRKTFSPGQVDVQGGRPNEVEDLNVFYQTGSEGLNLPIQSIPQSNQPYIKASAKFGLEGEQGPFNVKTTKHSESDFKRSNDRNSSWNENGKPSYAIDKPAVLGGIVMAKDASRDPRVIELLADTPGAKLVSSEEVVQVDTDGQEKKTLSVTLETPDGEVTTYEYVDFTAPGPSSTRPDTLPLNQVTSIEKSPEATDGDATSGEEKGAASQTGSGVSHENHAGSAPVRGQDWRQDTWTDDRSLQFKLSPHIEADKIRKTDAIATEVKRDLDEDQNKLKGRLDKEVDGGSEGCQSAASVVEEAVERVEVGQTDSPPGVGGPATEAEAWVGAAGQRVGSWGLGYRSEARSPQKKADVPVTGWLERQQARMDATSSNKQTTKATAGDGRRHSASSESSAASMGAHERGVKAVNKEGKSSQKTGKTQGKPWLQKENKDDRREKPQTLQDSGDTVPLDTYASCSMVLPHVRRVPPLKPGRSVAVEGVVNKPAKEFSISLQTGPSTGQGSQVALLFNPIVEEKKIVCNSFLYDNWGAAQTETKKVPFIEGRKFAIRIAVEQYNYQIFVNDVHLIDYEHRISFDKVTHIRLDGDAYFLFCEYPYELDLPYVLEESSGLRTGQHIVLDAFIWRKAISFEVNLQCGEKYPEISASLVLRAAFPRRGKPKLDITSFYNESFGEDMAVGGDIPLLAGRDLKLTIQVDNDVFKVMVGSAVIAEYPHSLPVKKLTHVLVDGDISLYGLKVTRPRRKSSVHRAAKKWKHSCCVVL